MKTKIDILIKGNLVVSKQLLTIGGGYNLITCKEDEIDEHFDVSEATVFVGNLFVDDFVNRANVLVTGTWAIRGGGCHG